MVARRLFPNDPFIPDNRKKLLNYMLENKISYHKMADLLGFTENTLRRVLESEGQGCKEFWLNAREVTGLELPLMTAELKHELLKQQKLAKEKTEKNKIPEYIVYQLQTEGNTCVSHNLLKRVGIKKLLKYLNDNGLDNVTYKKLPSGTHLLERG